MKPQFETFRNKGRWSFRLRGKNGKIICASARSYAKRGNAKDAIYAIMNTLACDEVEIVDK